MNNLPERLRDWSDDAVTGRNIMGSSSDLRDAAREIEQLREVVFLALEYWEHKNRRYKTRVPAWVNRAIPLGFHLIKWK